MNQKGYTVRCQVNHPDRPIETHWVEVVSDCSYQEAISVMSRLRKTDPTKLKVRFYLVWPDGNETHMDQNWKEKEDTNE